MIERSVQFNLSKTRREMGPGGYWLLRCDKGDLLEEKRYFIDVLRIKETHEKIKSHHVSIDPKPARVDL